MKTDVRMTLTLDSTTYRWATRSLNIGGTHWGGSIRRIGNLRRSVGSLLQPQLIASSTTVTLDNKDGAIRQLIDAEELANRPVLIEAGIGEDNSTYEEIFTGVVHFPGGVQSWDEQFLTIALDDTSSPDARNLPINKFFTSSYADVEEKSKNEIIPIVYGSWLDSDEGAQQVPCYCIDTGTNQFKISDRNVKQIQYVYKDGVSVAFSVDSLSNATFTLDGAVSYDPAINTITAHVEGCTDDGTNTGVLIDTIPGVIQDVLTTYLGVTSGSIDATAFSDWEGNLGVNDVVRRVLRAEQSSNTIISELLVEGFADMYIEAGKYTPVYRSMQAPSGVPTYRQHQILPKGKQARQFRVSRDAERIYCNEVVGISKEDPVTGTYADRYESEDAGAISRVRTRRRRRIVFKWMYKQSGVQSRVNRELMAFAAEAESVYIDLNSDAITLAPTGQFRLIYNKYGNEGNGIGTPFQARDINLNFSSFSNMFLSVRAWSLLNLSAGTWTPDTGIPANWLAATDEQKEIYGYFTDASGFADTSGSPSSESKRSRWF